VVKRQREATGDGEGVVGGPVTMREKLENTEAGTVPSID
jgi:hypothetical protein